VAAAALPGSRIDVEDVGLNPTQNGTARCAPAFGARVHVEVTATLAGEPCGLVTVEGDRMGTLDIAPEEVPGLIDELPAIAALAAHGEVTVRGRASCASRKDRIAALVAGFRALGINAEERADGLIAGPAAGSRRPPAGAPTRAAITGWQWPSRLPRSQPSSCPSSTTPTPSSLLPRLSRRWAGSSRPRHIRGALSESKAKADKIYLVAHGRRQDHRGAGPGASSGLGGHGHRRSDEQRERQTVRYFARQGEGPSAP
jgi:hypothetical protein